MTPDERPWLRSYAPGVPADVVPVAPGTEKDWQQPPFDGVIADALQQLAHVAAAASQRGAATAARHAAR